VAHQFAAAFDDAKQLVGAAHRGQGLFENLPPAPYNIECCLRAHQNKLWHMGMRSPVARNTLANANEHRDWRVWADFADVLIREARELCAGDNFVVDLEQAAYAFDSTTISPFLALIIKKCSSVS